MYRITHLCKPTSCFNSKTLKPSSSSHHPVVLQPGTAEPVAPQPVWLHLRLELRPRDGELCLSCYLAVAAGGNEAAKLHLPHYRWPCGSLTGRRHSSPWHMDAVGRRWGVCVRTLVCAASIIPPKAPALGGICRYISLFPPLHSVYRAYTDFDDAVNWY